MSNRMKNPVRATRKHAASADAKLIAKRDHLWHYATAADISSRVRGIIEQIKARKAETPAAQSKKGGSECTSNK